MAATKLYLADSPLSQIGPLNMLETAQALSIAATARPRWRFSRRPASTIRACSN